MMFGWYLERGISKVVGCNNYNDRTRKWIPLSQCKIRGEGGQELLLHDSDEPFYVVLYHNHYQRWIYQMEWMRDHPSAKNIPKRGEDNKNEPYLVHSLYTIQNGGQQRLGGWNKAGITKYNELYTAYVQAKYNLEPAGNLRSAKPENIKPEWIQFEMDFLVKLREKLNVTQDQKKKGKDTNTAPAEPVEEPLGMDWD